MNTHSTRPFPRRRGRWGLGALALAGTLSAAGAAHADTLTYTDSIPTQQLDWSLTLSVPQFDPTLGTLNSATITLAGNIQSNIGLENLDPNLGHTLHGSAQAEVDLLFPPPCDPNTDPNGCLIIASLPGTPVKTFVAAKYDGTTDFAGTSGTTFVGQVGSDSETAMLSTVADLAYFIGSGTVNMPANAFGSGTSSGSSNLASLIVSQAGSSATIVYDYTPFPPCVPLDDCHVAGTHDSTGTCSNPLAPDGSTCSDGNACTQTDTCLAGVCVGSNPVTCTAQDQCHTPGTCDTTSGVCSNPPAVNGTSCNDGNACTQTDTCQSGTCTGSNPVTCTASDQCHTPGTCDTTTGACSNPTAADGTSCNDGNGCTQTDICQAGTCVGTNPVTCTASDQCHTPGTCDTTSGTCSNPTAVNGTSCNDGNACTQTDTCQNGTCAGSNPVTCTASDQCHAPGTCNPASGTCSNPAKADGSSCSDGNACTQTDTCQAGACTGGNPVTCPGGSDACHTQGTCNQATGTCSNPTATNGTPCNDGNACTQTDTCQNGTCSGANPVTCTPQDDCHEIGPCDPTTGDCGAQTAKPDGSACSAGICIKGVCNPPGTSFGDPHIATRDGLFYDFHAAGDFVLVTSASGFGVQARQSLVPNQPNLAWNTMIAVGLGGHRVNVYGSPFRASIDGVTITLVNNVPHAIAGGHSLVLSGTTYTVHRATGETAQITSIPNSPALDVVVHMTGPSSGLLGDGDGNIANDLTVRNGPVLSFPVTTSELYGAFAQSWRVTNAESLFDGVAIRAHSKDGSPSSEQPFSVPDSIFTVADLGAAERANAQHICEAAGVSNEALRDACTLDVAVTGNPAFADLYHGMASPGLVLKPASAGNLDVSDPTSSEPDASQTAHACAFEPSSRSTSWLWLFAAAAVALGLRSNRKR